MNEKLTILLLQLPNPDFALQARWGNVPLAAGYLKSMIHKENLDDQATVTILDKQDMDHAGDARLINLIVQQAPDLLGFSLYLWNCRRTMYIAREVKKRLPQVKIIVGGPEITPEADYVFSNEAIDFGCFGDGEITFVEVVRQLLSQQNQWADIKGLFFRGRGGVVINTAREYIEDLNTIPSPILMGTFNLREYPILSYEILRGCPFHCSYCSWATVPLRFFSAARIIEELTYIIPSGIKLVRFIESNPLVHPEFETIFQAVKEINKDKKVRFAAFASFHQFSEEKIKLMKSCNFDFVEIGLQTVNPDTLKKLRRPPLDKQKFVDAVRLLQKYNIRYDIDTMLGLPGEGYADYRKTVRFIKDNQLGHFNTFPLMLLPGTQIRREADTYGIRYQHDPPHYILDSPSIRSDELDRVEQLNTRGMNKKPAPNTFLSVFEVPPLKGMPQPQQKIQGDTIEIRFINKLIVSAQKNEKTNNIYTIENREEPIAERADNPFTLWVQLNSTGGKRPAGIASFLKRFCSKNPYALLILVLEYDSLRTLGENQDLGGMIQTKEILLGPRRVEAALRKWIILPYSDLIHKEIARYKGENEQTKFFLSFNISTDWDWKPALIKLMSNPIVEGAVVSISSKFSLNQLLTIFEFLRQKNYKKLFFRNIFHYVVYELFERVRSRDRDKIFIPNRMETILTVDESFHTQSLFKLDNQMRLYFAGLQMKLIRMLR